MVHHSSWNIFFVGIPPAIVATGKKVRRSNMSCNNTLLYTNYRAKTMMIRTRKWHSTKRTSFCVKFPFLLIFPTFWLWYQILDNSIRMYIFLMWTDVRKFPIDEVWQNQAKMTRSRFVVILLYWNESSSSSFLQHSFNLAYTQKTQKRYL